MVSCIRVLSLIDYVYPARASLPVELINKIKILIMGHIVGQVIGLYAKYLCSRDALGLKAKQPAGQARDNRVSCIQVIGLTDVPSSHYSNFSGLICMG